jgi:tripartite-type tricarboxylate transporter receptor subunit TctC
MSTKTPPADRQAGGHPIPGLKRRQALLAGLALSLGPAAGVMASEPAFPSRPVTIIVPFAPGGSLDLTARIIADRLKEVLGHPVLISNRPGAGSAVGARAAATSPADGYTLFLASASAFGFLHMLVPSFEFRLADFIPIGAVATNSSVIAVSTGVPVRSLGELVELARAKPQEMNFCTTGAGGMNHLQLEMFRGLARSKAGGRDMPVTHVPYNGVAPALQALKAQNVQACTLPYSALVRNLDGKDLRILAVMRPNRLPQIGHVPTTGEQGFAEMDGNDAFVNLSVPKGTPAPVVARLEAALKQVMADPAVIKRLEEVDVQPTYLGARDTLRWLEDDVRKFSAVVRESGLATAR